MLEFEQNEDRNLDPVEMMRMQFDALKVLPQNVQVKASLLSIHPDLTIILNGMVQAVKEMQVERPEGMDAATGEAILYHNNMTIMVTAIVLAALRAAEEAQIGCFHPKDQTVEGPHQDPNLVDMTTAEIYKMLGMDENDGIN